MSTERDPSVPENFLASLEKWKAVRSLGPEHELLGQLSGDWRVSVRFHGGGEIFETEAHASKRLAHGGRFLVEELEGEIQAPDASGRMRPEPYSATRVLGYDRYKHAWVGTFCESQNTHLLVFCGVETPSSGPRELVLFGLADEPMLDLRDTTLRHVLRVEAPDRHVWEVSAMAAGGRRVFDLVYTRPPA
ncbi:MAG: DUF1579 family protein [Gemmatimonadota bacterium]